MYNKSLENKVNLGQVFKEGSFLFYANFSLLITFTLYVYGPLNLIRTVIPDVYLTEKYGKSIVTLLVSGTNLLNALLSLFAFIGIAYVVEKSREGEAPSLKNTLKFSFSRLADVFWTNLLLSLIGLGLALLLIIPAIIWGNYYSFAPTIATLRNLKGKAALEYSKKLVKGQWWKIFGIQFIFGIAVASINLCILILSRGSQEIKFLSIFLSLTAINIVGAIATVMVVVLFSKVEDAKNMEKQNRIKG
jgi:hypothetical protein